jgi:hypothetical protein
VGGRAPSPVQHGSPLPADSALAGAVGSRHQDGGRIPAAPSRREERQASTGSPPEGPGRYPAPPSNSSYRICIASWCAVGLCIGVAIIVWHPARTPLLRTPVCPFLATSRYAGATLWGLLQAAGSACWAGGYQLSIMAAAGLQSGPGVAVGVSRTVATLTVALGSALRPAVDICHPDGVFSQAPGWYAAVCDTVQPLLWVASRAHAKLLADLVGPVVSSISMCSLAWVTKHAYASGHTTRDADSMPPGVLSWGLVLPGALFLYHVGAARVVAGVRRACRALAPGMSGTFTPYIWVGYWSCMIIASHWARPGFPTAGTSPVLYLFKTLLWAATLVSVTSLYTVTGCPTTWEALRGHLLSCASSLRTQVQVAVLLSVAVTAELAVRPDVVRQVLKPILARTELQVSILTLTFISVAAGLLPHAWDWVVSRTKCLPAQPIHRRWCPDSMSGGPGDHTVDPTADGDAQGTDGGNHLPPACVDAPSQPAGVCPNEGSTQASEASNDATPEGVAGDNPTLRILPVHACEAARHAPVARVQDDAAHGPTTSADDKGDDGDLVSTRTPQVALMTTCTDPGTQLPAAPQGAPVQADRPRCSEPVLGDTAVSHHPDRSGEGPTCSDADDQQLTSDGTSPTGNDCGYCYAVFGYRAVSLAVAAGGAYLLLTLVLRMVSTVHRPL